MVGRKTPIIKNEKGINLRKIKPSSKATINDAKIFLVSLNKTKPIEKKKQVTIKILINNFE
jgi:hypothetical protein